MLIDFRAIVQNKYGAPEKVLSIAKRQFNGEEAGAARPTTTHGPAGPATLRCKSQPGTELDLIEK
jgi:hypothetical protein